MNCYQPEHTLLIRENVLDSLAYASCITFLLFILRTIFFPPAHNKYYHIPPSSFQSKGKSFISKHKKHIFLLLYIFLLFALASIFYLLPIIKKNRIISSWKPYEEAKTRLWHPSPLVKPLLFINDALACILLEYLVYLSWYVSDDIYTIRNTSFMLLYRLSYKVFTAQSIDPYKHQPLMFEVLILIYSINRLLLHKLVYPSNHSNGSSSSSSSPPSTFLLVLTFILIALYTIISFLDTFLHKLGYPSNRSNGSSSPSPPSTFFLVLTFILSALYTILFFLDTFLHQIGILRSCSEADLHHMMFWDSVMFYGAFLVQAIMIMYWAEGGPVFKKDDQPIALSPDENGYDLERDPKYLLEHKFDTYA